MLLSRQSQPRPLMPAITCIYSGRLLLPIVQINLRVGPWFPTGPVRLFMMPLTADFLSAGIPAIQGMPAVLQPIPTAGRAQVLRQLLLTERPPPAVPITATPILTR